jgi:hypothetical protein
MWRERRPRLPARVMIDAVAWAGEPRAAVAIR